MNNGASNVFASLPIGVNLSLFGLAAAVVWVAGTRLAASTSLPELSTTIAAVRIRPFYSLSIIPYKGHTLT